MDGVEIGSEGNRARENTVMTVELTAGVHQLDFWHYENGGGAGVSLYVYRGTDQEPPPLNGGDYELLQAVDVFHVVTTDSDGDDMDDFAETFFFEGLDRDGSGDSCRAASTRSAAGRGRTRPRISNSSTPSA